MTSHIILLVVAILLLANCSSQQEQKKAAPLPMLTKQPFGSTGAAETVDLYTLTNSKGMEVKISTYGGAVVSLKVPDKSGKVADIVLGFDSLDGYQAPNPYFGAIIGRYGNRIAKGEFKLNGATFKLAVNDGANHLHGGLRGFDKILWRGREMHSPDGVRLDLTYMSKDGEEGYPGELNTTVSYTVAGEKNELRIDYEAVTTKDTVLNLTNHSYFNLAGQGEGDILNHSVTILADRFTPVDKGLIPTGELKSVDGTPFDFRTPRTIGERIDAKDPQLVYGKGYDHNFVLNKIGGDLELVARATEPTTGRSMQVLTTEPGMQFYTGNFLDGTITGKNQKVYGRRAAFCMETQHFPNSPNQPSFPSTTLKPVQRYRSTTVYRFSTIP